MKRLKFFSFFLIFFFFRVAQGGGESNANGSTDLGIVPIGGIPHDLQVFAKTDCGEISPKFSDCSAKDAEGREYGFFEGGLSFVSATRSKTTKSLRLPAGLKFGEDIDHAAKKVTATFGIKLYKETAHDGMTAYSSYFVVKSSKGVPFSIVLIADEKERLDKIVERVDF